MRLSRSGLLTTLLVIAALFVGSALTSALPDPEESRLDPFPVAGALGEPVRLRTSEFTLTGVRPAKTVELHNTVAATAGVWLVVAVTYEPLGQPGTLTGSQGGLRSRDGRWFGGTQAIANNCGPANPGLPVTCDLPFEVPVDALEGLILAIPAEAGSWGADQVTDIDLGITPERAAEFAATDAHIALAPSQVVRR